MCPTSYFVELCRDETRGNLVSCRFMPRILRSFADNRSVGTDLLGWERHAALKSVADVPRDTAAASSWIGNGGKQSFAEDSHGS
jgi:hypothetical protein